jgi:hypothetical protein
VVTPPPSAPRTIWWPPLYLVVVIGATIVAVAAVRTFKPNPKTGVVAPAAAATASVTVLGLITAGLLQFEDKLGDQGYLLAILIGCFTIAPLVGRQFQTWQTKAWVTGLLLAAMIGGFATIFSLRYALGPEDVVTKQPTVVSGWEWLLSDLGSVTPGVWGSALVLVIVFLTNLTLTFWKPKGS